MTFASNTASRRSHSCDMGETQSETALKAVVAALEPLMLKSETSEDVAQIVGGGLVGYIAAVFCCCDDLDHRQAILNISNCLPQASSHARRILNLPPLKDI